MIEGYPKPFGYRHRSIFQGLNLSPNWQVNSERLLLTMVMRDLLTQTTGRSGLDPFGVVSYSAHLIGFVKHKNETKYRVPKRSATKPTVPDKLDSTVAGVIRSGERPVDWIARKIAVEASVPKEYTTANIVACGTVSYQMSITSTGKPGCQHIISYLFEMEFDRMSCGSLSVSRASMASSPVPDVCLPFQGAILRQAFEGTEISLTAVSEHDSSGLPLGGLDFGFPGGSLFPAAVEWATSLPNH
ncbi:hypothetical protein F5144DRAFT_588032 [Chaetomium tenue]|uniref:Uncharacterized protein n=1 Tax=Chaetomium tenue TaxID=1854479 RepID=A0ACB7PK90_9PEZI|nr:hypothetical protein F5144DRAFT_588032 [Chaetomium globosum]